jgi:hypothetical protein
MNPFKHIVLIAIATLAFIMPGRCASPEADVKQVVETFYKQYYRDFLKKDRKGGGDAQLIKWVDASPYVSPRFKKAVAKALTDARKKDRELGLESDPIIAGQDYPEKGYQAANVKVTQDRATATAKGIEAKGFDISLGLVNSGGHWLIDRIADIPPAGK